MTTEKILVTGATGKIGRELVPRLLAAGVEVKAGTRNPDRGRSLFPSGVEVVELNYNRTETYDAALTWADRVFLMPPPFSPDAHASIVPFLDWAVSTRVRHVVLLTGMAVTDFDELPLRRVERHLEDQDTEHTILRPNLYMQNFHPGFISRQIREDGRIRLPAGQGKVSLVDVRDVAAVASRALTSDDHFGRALPLTGPESLTLEEAAEVVSEAAGRSIPFESVGDEDFRGILSRSGWGPAEIEAILGLFGSIREGGRAAIHPEGEEILERELRNFRSFAREHARSWD